MDGLCRRLLAIGPDDVRAQAADVLAARRAAEWLVAAVGRRPPSDRRAEHDVEAAFAVLRRARADRNAAAQRRHRALAAGNVAGTLLLAVAALLVGTGRDLASVVVAALVAASPAGPLAGLVAGAVGLARANRRARGAAAACGEALDRLGVGTLGEARARRIRLDAWLCRRQEARVAVERAALLDAAWQALAGPWLRPERVEEALAEVERLRQEELARLGAGLAALRATEVAGGPVPGRPPGSAEPAPLAAPAALVA